MRINESVFIEIEGTVDAETKEEAKNKFVDNVREGSDLAQSPKLKRMMRETEVTAELQVPLEEHEELEEEYPGTYTPRWDCVMIIQYL